mmetsp:Transcript_19035/g.30297  ORF Transcript_19035/g.30297 Transcript_19035/m.30297 type:complete len:120 (+) Transcript_19035:168-527(+)|eukprot:CAMPEP_0202685862 /NCGR_PEP_ID=MMETSP1385-20130828/1703_1 /ASSEMBLY_ACC=CAM_ASM_000861 /TAXON_ID=933848 /ORGANISM="Elphidium margaritaceum" /LENGTH=119 /DNA_ID=CAMNT_0049340329 /DNA_START=92 /DNA_END=451 /DNA_ORIENTATION=-
MQSDQFFQSISGVIGQQEFDDDLTATFQFEISKDGKTSVWCIDPANKKIIKGGVSEPTCTFTMSDADFMKLINKEAEAAELFMSGKLKLDGDMGEAMKFQQVMEGFDSDDMRANLKSKL